MNEEEIVARDNAGAKASAPEERVATEPDMIKSDGIDVATKMDIFRELNLDMNYLTDDAINTKVKDITDWAQFKNPNMNLRDIVFMIQEIQSKVGRNGNSSLDNVWQYATLDIERMKIEGKMKLMERKDG